jgi:hypothetical protein
LKTEVPAGAFCRMKAAICVPHYRLLPARLVASLTGHLAACIDIDHR